MTVIENVRTVPRTILTGYIRAARLPLTAVERITGQQENEQWPPAITFEALEAGVEGFVGSTLHDPVLIDRAALRKAKVAQLRRSLDLTAAAAQEREQAAATLEQEQQAAEAERAESERRAEQRQHDLERQAELHEQKVQKKAAEKKAAADKAKAEREKAITRRERATKVAVLAEESQALETTKQALDAAQTVEVIDDTLQGTKAARATS